MPFYADEIPGAMDKMEWANGAALMRYWFSHPTFKMPIEMRVGKKLSPKALQRMEEENKARQEEHSQKNQPHPALTAEQKSAIEAYHKNKKEEDGDPLDISNIPREKFFERDSTSPDSTDLEYIDPMEIPDDQYNDKIISIKWVLSFQRARFITVGNNAAFFRMPYEKHIPTINVEDFPYCWDSEAEKSMLKKRLKKAGWRPGKIIPVYLGKTSMGARELD